MKKHSLNGRFLRAAARAISAVAALAASVFAGDVFAADQTFNANANVATAWDLNVPMTTFSLNYSSAKVATQGGTGFTGVVSGTGNLVVDGSYNGNSGGILIFSAVNTYTGSTTIKEATLRVTGRLDSPISNHTYAGNIELGDKGVLDLRLNEDQTLAGNITGTGSLMVASGSYLVKLTGTRNTYSGLTAVSSGTLAFGGNNVYSPNSGLALTGGLFYMYDQKQAIASLASTTAGTIDLGNFGELTVNQTGPTTFKGKIIGGSSSAVIKTGPETLYFSDANLSDFSGKLSIRAGKLGVNTDSTFGTVAKEINGGTLLLTANNVASAYTKEWTVGASGGFIEVEPRSSRFAGNISGTGQLTKVGANVLEINGTVSAPFRVAEGTLGGKGTVERVTFAPGVTINPGIYTPGRGENNIGTLHFGTAGNTTQFNDVVLQLDIQNAGNYDRIAVTGKADFGTTAANTFALRSSTANWVRGTYTILTTTESLNTANLSSTVFQYNGTTVDTANSRLRASLTVTPQLDADGAPTGAQNLVLNTFAAAALNITWNQTGRTGVEWNKGAGAPTNWREDTRVNQTFVDGDIVNFVDTTNIQKNIPVATTYAGTETAHNGVVVGGVTVSGTNFVFSGGAISGVASGLVGPGLTADGKLRLLADASATFNNNTSFAGVEIAQGANAVFTGKFSAPTVNNNGRIELNRVADSPLAGANYSTFTGVITGEATGIIEKTGTGELTLSGNNSAFQGTVRVSGGTLTIASDNNLGTGANILAGGTLKLTGRSYYKSWELTGTGGTITFDSTRNQTNTTLYGTLSGTGNFAKTGTGILYLAGANTYTGTTTINTGIVEVRGLLGAPENAVLPPDPEAADPNIPVLRPDAVGNYAGNIVLAAGALSFSSANNQNLSGTISNRPDEDGKSQGSLTKAGTGTLTLEGSKVTHSFATLVASKTDTVVQGNLAVDSITVGSSIAADQVSFTVAGNITGTSVTNLGNGTFTIAGNITGTTVANRTNGTFTSNGTITANVTNAGSFTTRGVTGDFTNQAGGTFTLAADLSRTRILGALNNSGTIRFTAPGQTLQANSLDNNGTRGSAGYYEMAVDFADSENSNKIQVSANAPISGTHVFQITPSNLSVVNGETRYSLIQGSTNYNGAAFRLDQPIMAGIYRLTTGDGTTPVISTTGYSPTGRILATASAMLSADWFAQLDNIAKRQGSLRLTYFAENNAAAAKDKQEPTSAVIVQEGKSDAASANAPNNEIWLRAHAQQVEANLKSDFVIGNFREYQYGIDAGYDHAFHLDDSNKLLLGVFIGFLGTHRHFLDEYHSFSDTHSALGGIYATWLHKAGWFADVIIKGQRLSTEFHNNYSTQGEDSGSFEQSGFGVSLEFGKRFDLPAQWFIEPSAQIAITHILSAKQTFGTARFTGDIENLLFTTIDDSTILRYGFQVLVGRVVSTEGYGFVQPYLKVGIEGLSTSGGDIYAALGTGDQNSIHANADGISGVCGAGIAWQFTKAHQIHFDYEASFGQKYDRPWIINLGYRYSF